MKINFINAYFSNNGTLLKQEINKLGINDDLLERMNYLSESKKSNIHIPEQFAGIVNDINKSAAKLMSKGIINENVMNDLMSWQVGNSVLSYSNIGLDGVEENLARFNDYFKNQQQQSSMENSQVMSKVA